MAMSSYAEPDFKQEEWYTEQTAEWAALARAGWKFGRPPNIQCFTGIEMRHVEHPGVIAYVRKSQAPKDIHSQLLALCKAHAGNWPGKDGTEADK